MRGRSDAALLYSARLFIERAFPYWDEFVRYAMPPDLIDTLNEHIQNIEQLTRERSDARTALKEATAAIDAALTEGMNAATELDVILTNTLHANTPLLASGRERVMSRESRERKRRPRRPVRKAQKDRADTDFPFATSKLGITQRVADTLYLPGGRK